MVAAVLGSGIYLLVQLGISQHRKSEAAAEAQSRLIKSLPEGWRFCYSVLSRLNDYSGKVAALKSYAESQRLRLTPLSHEQLELFMALFDGHCWEKRAAIELLSKYVISGRTPGSG